VVDLSSAKFRASVKTTVKFDDREVQNEIGGVDTFRRRSLAWFGFGLSTSLVAEVFKDFLVELRAMDGSIIWNTIALTKFACSQMVLVALRLYIRFCRRLFLIICCKLTSIL
jgi:hypothetical protein